MMCRFGTFSRSGKVVYCRADLGAAGVFLGPSPNGIYSVPRLWCEDSCPVRLKEASEGEPRRREGSR